MLPAENLAKPLQLRLHRSRVSPLMSGFCGASKIEKQIPVKINLVLMITKPHRQIVDKVCLIYMS